MKILVMPDIHGRKFWKVAINEIANCDKVVFLGDYLDPYDFENISVTEAIANFREIIAFAKEHQDKVILLLGNHDMPYFSTTYLGLSSWYCRYSTTHHEEIEAIFEENRSLFKIAHIEDDILFTHAGCTSDWLDHVFGQHNQFDSLHDLANRLNDLLNSEEGLQYLHIVSYHRCGPYPYGSCIWADKEDTDLDQKIINNHNPATHIIANVKQVFGHTLQAYYGAQGDILSGKAQEYYCCKMLDNRMAYVLDTEKYKIKKINNDYK